MSMLPTTSFAGIGSNEQVFLFNLITSFLTSFLHTKKKTVSTYLELLYMTSDSVVYLYLVFYPGFD